MVNPRGSRVRVRVPFLDTRTLSAGPLSVSSSRPRRGGVVVVVAPSSSTRHVRCRHLNPVFPPSWCLGCRCRVPAPDAAVVLLHLSPRRCRGVVGGEARARWQRVRWRAGEQGRRASSPSMRLSCGCPCRCAVVVAWWRTRARVRWREWATRVGVILRSVKPKWDFC